MFDVINENTLVSHINITEHNGHENKIPTHQSNNIRSVGRLRNYSKQEILDLAKSKKTAARNELIHVVTDLIEEPLSSKERDLAADIIISLISQAMTDIRESVSSKLAYRDDVPEKLVLHLAHDEIEVAQHILLNSPLLSDEHLSDIIRHYPRNYCDCIARRRELSASIIDQIVDLRKKETSIKLAQNNDVLLTDYAYKVLGEMILAERDMAEPVLTRRDVPLDLAQKVYSHVGKTMQNYIRQKFSDNMGADLIGEVTEEIAKSIDGQFKPNDQMRQEVAQKKRDGGLTLKNTIDTLRRGQIPSFIAMFSEYMGLSEQIIENILREDNGRSLAVICRYEGIGRADFVAIFLMMNKIRSYEDIVPQNQLQKAMRYYDKITDKIAQHLMQHIRRKDRH